MALEKTRGRIPQKDMFAVVVGAGKSGLAATKLLLKKGAKVRLLEQNRAALSPTMNATLHRAGVEVIFGEHSPRFFANADFVIPSPGLSLHKLMPMLGKYAKQPNMEIIAELELAWRCLANEPILAITGTSGKTTTASLAAAMLRAQNYKVFLGGNIGTPLSEYVCGKDKADVLVLEVSSFQLQACNTFCPRVAILLNISQNHLDYHHDMQEYTEAKFRIFRCQEAGDLAIMGDGLQALSKNFKLRSRLLFVKPEQRFTNSPLAGLHNRINEEAAWQACRFFGINEDNATKAVENFQQLPHRLETVANINGIRYINDSKSTTVTSLKVALEAFHRPLRLLCGGHFKGGDLGSLRELVQKKVSAVYLFGESRELFEEAWQNTVPISWFPNLKEAFEKANAEAKTNDIVIMSPATSSFDLYKNYIERGNDFKSLVNALTGAKTEIVANLTNKMPQSLPTMPKVANVPTGAKETKTAPVASQAKQAKPARPAMPKIPTPSSSNNATPNIIIGIPKGKIRNK